MASKKAVNLSLDGDLLRQARALGLNLSSVAEEALAHAVSARLAERWLEDNRDAIGAYNQRVALRGVFSEGLRAF